MAKNKSRFLASVNQNFNAVQKAELASSSEFMAYFTAYLKGTGILNHLDISGMNFDRVNLRQIVRIAPQITPLMALHLSDLGILNNRDFAIEVLEAFNVQISKVTHS